MGWVVPAIIAAKGVVDWFGNKRKENSNVRRGLLDYASYEVSPYRKAVNDYIRNYWTTHNLQDRVSPELLESLLRQPAFDRNDPRYKIPGGGARLGGAFADAIAAYYKGKANKENGIDDTDYSEFFRGGPGGGNAAATSLYGSTGTMSRPGTSGLFSGDGDYPAGTAIGEGLPGGQAPTPASLPAGPNYGPSVGNAMGTTSRAAPPGTDADPYDAESILAGILRGDGTPGGLFGGTGGQFDGSGAAYAVPLRRALRGKTQGLGY